MTPEQLDIDELERLEKAATPGPWEIDVLDKDRDGVDVQSSVEVQHHYKNGKPKGRAYKPSVTCSLLWGMRRDDAELIAAARNALPSLIAEVRRLRDENERLTGEPERGPAVTMGNRE